MKTVTVKNKSGHIYDLAESEANLRMKYDGWTLVSPPAPVSPKKEKPTEKRVEKPEEPTPEQKTEEPAPTEEPEKTDDEPKKTKKTRS